MSTRSAIWATVAIAALGVPACKTTQSPAPNSAGEVSAGTPAPATSGGSGGEPAAADRASRPSSASTSRTFSTIFQCPYKSTATTFR